MGGVDLSDQMTAVNKSKKQKRRDLCIFLKIIVLLSTYNPYILEGHKRQHIPGGRRRTDLLSFKYVCNWLATSHNKASQLLLTKEEDVQTHQCLHISLMSEPIFPSKRRGRTTIVWYVKESTFHQWKQVLKTPHQDTRQLSSAASVVFTCALGKGDQIVSMIITLKRTLPARNNKWDTKSKNIKKNSSIS